MTCPTNSQAAALVKCNTYGLESITFSWADFKLLRARVDGVPWLCVQGELAQDEMVLSDVNPPPHAWWLFLTLQQRLPCGSPGTCVAANWPEGKRFNAFISPCFACLQKIMCWWELGWEWTGLFISGKKEGRKSNSSYTNICFPSYVPGNGRCQLDSTLCFAY